MKAMIAVLGLAGLALAGCTSSEYSSARYQDPYFTRDYDNGERIVVREYDGRSYDHRDYRGTPYYQNNMEPRVRGKHPDALGWNTENYYLQRGY